MTLTVKKNRFRGAIRVPASKSHTIRRLLIAALSEGETVIEGPLDSLDARSCAALVRALGAELREERGADPACPNPADSRGEKLLRYAVRGAPALTPGLLPLAAPVLVDAGNSGTTLFLGLAAAALRGRAFSFDGDAQLRRRSAGPLLDALRGLGARVDAAPGGCAPVTVRGPLCGGRVSIECPTSQYLSALLLACPLCPAGTLCEIAVPLLNERPYVEMTLAYLEKEGVPFEAAPDFSWFRVPGGASYRPLNGPVPGDFSTAAFPAAAAALNGGPLTIQGLDPEDRQGDKVIFQYLKDMGCEVEWKREAEWTVTVSRAGPLRGGAFNLNATPDLLPVMAVLGACAEGGLTLSGAAHARIKETDRIKVMAGELAKLGAGARETPDGLVLAGGAASLPPPPGPAPLTLEGHGDHRIVMALALLAEALPFPIAVTDAEAAAVTYPGFWG